MTMLSIIIPVYNEEKSIHALYCQLLEVIEKLHETYEVIFIDDGSIDESLHILKQIKQEDTNVRIFSFRKNQGKAEALNFGFTKAKGDYIATLDADLQDKPSEIPKLLEKIKEGWDVVCGWRKNRQDSFFKVFSSLLFNFFTRVFWGLALHDYNGGLKLYKKDAAKSLHLYGGMHRFIPILLYQQGFTVSEIEVVHQKRAYGKSKYGFSKIFKELPDMFTMLFLTRYSKRPLHFFSMVGSILFLLGVLILGYLSIIHFQGTAIGRRPLLFLGMLLVLSGFQVLFTGFLADLIISIFYSKRGENSEKEKFLLKYSSE